MGNQMLNLTTHNLMVSIFQSFLSAQVWMVQMQEAEKFNADKLVGGLKEIGSLNLLEMAEKNKRKEKIKNLPTQDQMGLIFQSFLSALVWMVQMLEEERFNADRLEDGLREIGSLNLAEKVMRSKKKNK